MPYDGEIPPYGDLPEPPEELDRLARAVIGAAIEVHRQLGAGMPEEGYEGAMCIELTERGIAFERQKAVDIVYKGVCVAKGRIDLLVEGKLIVEIKSCEALAPVHRLQVLSYMRMIRQPLGLLINFNVPVLKEGIRRIISS
jgi:GxxExxY protein